MAALFGITAWAVFRGKAPKKPSGDPEWIPTELLRRGRNRVEASSDALAAIDLGIADADSGRTVPIEEVRKIIPEWMAKFESQRTGPIVGNGLGLRSAPLSRTLVI